MQNTLVNNNEDKTSDTRGEFCKIPIKLIRIQSDNMGSDGINDLQSDTRGEMGSDGGLNDLQSDTQGEIGSDGCPEENRDMPWGGDNAFELSLDEDMEAMEAMGSLDDIATQYFQYNGESISELLSGIRESIDAQCQCILRLTNVIEMAVSRLNPEGMTLPKNESKARKK